MTHRADSRLISAIVPVYNGAATLAEAVASILAQTGAALDVWIVDDGSTDGTADLAARLAAQSERVTVLRQANAGAAAARNAGLARARGDLLAFLDADDLWTPGRLVAQVAALDADPSLDAVFGYAEQFVSPELSEAERAALVCPPEPLPAYHPGGLLIRRAALEQGQVPRGWQR